LALAIAAPLLMIPLKSRTLLRNGAVVWWWKALKATFLAPLIDRVGSIFSSMAIVETTHRT
jgi:hypothetical protein